MVDEFMVCVDRIIASAYFESVNERGERLLSDEAHNHVVQVVGVDDNKNGEMGGCSNILVRECRICQEEDEQHQMEAPCACNGTLKFAHRKCIQRWCNKKGDITCEICNQVFSPNYDLPPAKNNSDVMTIDIRQAWGAHIDLRDPHFLAFAAAERQFLQAEYEEYAVASSGIDAYFAFTPSSDANERLWDDAGIINILQYPNFPSPACWFFTAMLCNCQVVVHLTKPKEEAGINTVLVNDKLQSSLLRPAVTPFRLSGKLFSYIFCSHAVSKSQDLGASLNLNAVILVAHT